MAEQNSDAYAKNKAWGEQKEREAANLLQQAYPEIFTRQTDITSQVVPQKDIKFLPPQPNLQILLRGTSNPPIIAWCESTRKTYADFIAYRYSLYVKLKTLNAMRPDHYLIKPLIRKIDDTITDIVAIRKPDMDYIRSIHQSDIHRTDGQPTIGTGWTAMVRVNAHSDLMRSGQKTSGTFLEALLATILNPKSVPVSTGAFDNIF